MNHKPLGIPFTKLLAETPEAPTPSLYVANHSCMNCGRHGWCIITILDPSPETQMSLVPYCGHCLVNVGLVIASEPLVHHEGQTTLPPMPHINRPGGEN